MATTQVFASERKTLTELLELYRNCPCLWNSNHALYGNKTAREQALADMLKTYRVLVVDANMDSLKKKIGIMRASYIREYKKVLRNRNHKPSLWFYNLMAFINDGTTTTDGYQSEEDDEEVSGTSETFSEELRKLLVHREGKRESYQHTAKRLKPSSVFLAEYSDPEESSHTIKTDVSETSISETEAFGHSLGLQLGGLTQMQKIVAEKLISDITYNARLDKLTTKTSLVNLTDDYLN